MSDDGEYRDERGRWLPGVNNGGPRPGGGRPRESDAERLRLAMWEVLDDETLRLWVLAMRKKLGKGNIVASEFLADRLIGRPAVNVHHESDGALAAFVTSWSAFVIGDECGAPPVGDNVPALSAGNGVLDAGDDQAA